MERYVCEACDGKGRRLVAKDEDDPGKVLHSPFESRVPFDLTMLETAPAGSAPGAF